MPARQFVKFLSLRRYVVELSTSGIVPSVRSSRRNHRNHRSRASPATTAPTATTATSANNNGGQLHVAASVFLIEEIERGETDVGHFLFAKNEALIGRDVVRSRDISRRYRVC